MQTIGVVGFGLMGSGIAQVSAQAGYNVIASDISQEILDTGLNRIERILKIEVRRKTLTEEDRAAMMSRMKLTTALTDLAVADLVIEAATEKLEIKKSIFKTLEERCGPETIFASNTSSLSITEIANSVARKDRFLGLHFFNPVPAMQLVEIARTLDTSPETVEAVKAYSEKIGKKVIITPDAPGFVVNALLVPYLINAVQMLEKGIATREEIDTAMKLGCGYPMGPLELLDQVGIDTAYHISEILFEETKDPKYAAPTMLRTLYRSGRLGKKTGEGFYQYGKKA